MKLIKDLEEAWLLVFSKQHEGLDLTLDEFVFGYVTVAPCRNFRQVDSEQPGYAEINFVDDVVCQLLQLKEETKRKRVPCEGAFYFTAGLKDDAVDQGVLEADVLREVSDFGGFCLLDEFARLQARQSRHGSQLFVN